MKAVVAAFNQEKALVGALYVITNLRMDLFETLQQTEHAVIPWSWPHHVMQHAPAGTLGPLEHLLESGNFTTLD